MKIFSLLGIGLLILGTAACTTKQPDCTDHFANGKPPAIVSESLAKKTAMLCYDGYAAMHSGIARAPLWSAEHLTEKRLDAARALKRKNAFHAEPGLPQPDRAELSDYVRSGMDRGHMAPSGDMPTEKAQQESFSLANIIPQNPNNNQNLWQGIEEGTRRLAERTGELYVVTGPIYEGSSLQRLNGRILVPTAVFKAIYNPAKNEAAAYVTPNSPGMEYQTLSITELEQRAKIDPFPSLSEEVKQEKMDLPRPALRSSRSGRPQPVEVD